MRVRHTSSTGSPRRPGRRRRAARGRLRTAPCGARRARPSRGRARTRLEDGRFLWSSAWLTAAERSDLGTIEPGRLTCRRDDEDGRVTGGRVLQGSGGRVDDHVTHRREVRRPAASEEAVQALEELARAGAWSARAASAVRTCPIAAAAASPWPTTSPTVRAILPSGSSKASYQSPPTSSTSLPASYNAARAISDRVASRAGSNARCSPTAISRSSASSARRAFSAATRSVTSIPSGGGTAPRQIRRRSDASRIRRCARCRRRPSRATSRGRPRPPQPAPPRSESVPSPRRNRATTACPRRAGRAPPRGCTHTPRPPAH